jgi:predicted PurR-regulated permease PerM
MVLKPESLNDATRWGLNVLALLGCVLALHLGQSIIIPTIIALLLGAMLWPSVGWMHLRLRFSWGFACLLAVSGLIALIFFISIGFVVAVPKLLQDLPDLRNTEAQAEIYKLFRERVSTVAPLDEEYLPADAGKSRVFQYVKETVEGPYIREALVQTAYYSNLWFWEWVLIMFLLLFMLLEGPMLSRRLVDIFGPSEDAKAKAVHALTDMAHHVRTYLVWRTIVNFGVALLVGLIYQYIFHLRHAWTWASLTAILFYVPYLGPLAAGVFPVVEAFLVDSPLAALGVIGIYAVVITVEGYFVVPVVMGHSLDLNATTVMLACLFWDLVWGLPGLFLAMPLMAAIKAVCTNVPDLQPWAGLMSASRGGRLGVRSRPELYQPPADSTQILTDEEIRQLEAKRQSLADPS